MAYIGYDEVYDSEIDLSDEDIARMEAERAWEEGMAICVNGIPLDIWLANHS